LSHLTVSSTDICTDEGLKAKLTIFTSTVLGAVFCEVPIGVIDVFVGSMGDGDTVGAGVGVCADVGVLVVLVHPNVKNILIKITKTKNSFLMVVYCYLCHIITFFS
jgi:hypothetical protein